MLSIRGTGWLTACAVVTVAWATAVPVIAETLDQRTDGSVWYNNSRFADLSAFHGSKDFHEAGLRCGTEHAMEAREVEFASRVDRVAQQRFTDCTNSVTNPAAEYDPVIGTTYTIPVWFHVIYNSSGTGNISQARIDAQMEVLNRDFAGLDGAGSNSTIQFTLAGVTRTQNDTWFTTDNEDLYKPDLVVDPSRNLNVYTKDLDGGLLGYAYLAAGAAGLDVDGVVMLHNTIGGRDNGYSVFNQGRTLVHEVGHYLGLFHTFQSIGGSCQNTNSSGDLITDTPPQSSADTACSAGTSCGVASALENFMNYSYDSCMTEFTAEQSNRMICSLTSFRSQAYTVSTEGGGPDPSPPVASNDTDTVTEDGSVDVAVTSNDSDPDSDLDLTSIVVTSAPSNGSAAANANGTITYTPAADFDGSDSFRYTINDQGGRTSNEATVSMTVTPVNDAPVANNDNESTNEDVAITFSVIANDTDVDGSVVGSTLTITRQPVNGTLDDLGNGSVRFTPVANYAGADNFQYTVQDDSGATSNVATATIIINAVDDPPVAGDDTATTAEDTPIAVSVLDNDADIDGTIAPATVAVVAQPANGAATVNGNGTITYTPAQDFNGSDSFTYTVDNTGGVTTNTATVSVTVTAVNDPPVANDDSDVTDEDVPVVIAVLGNDGDVDGSLIAASVTVVLPPGDGSAVANANGTITYTPDLNYNGSDTFTYTVDNAEGVTTASATVTVTVNEVNDPPVAVSDVGSVTEDTPQNLNVLSNDSDIDGALVANSVAVASQPANGSASANPDGSITYTPDLNFNGSDSFTYTVNDDGGLTSQAATVNVDVAAANDFPVALPDTASTSEDVAVLIDLTANDTDDEGSVVDSSLTVVDPPDHGGLVDNGDGTVVYTPTANYSGADSFTYTVRDAGGLTSAAALVSITISAVDDPVVAAPDSASTNEDTPVDIDLAGNDSDADGTINPATIFIIVQPGNGTVSSLGGGLVRYTPDANFSGTDTFDYTIRNTDSAVSDPATVTVTVGAVNDQPVATADSASVDEDSSVVISVLTNDSDTEGALDAATLAILTPPSHGDAVNNGNGTISYTPNADFNGEDSFRYTVADSEGLVSDPATVTITVRSIDDPTQAAPDTAVTNEDTSVTINVIDNDSDSDGTLDPASVVIAEGPANGGVMSNGDGTVVYTPSADYNGSDTFAYTIANTDGVVSNAAEVTVTITAVNDAPVARADVASTPVNTAVVINVVANDTDAEGSVVAASVVLVLQPTEGQAVVSSSGVVTYSPDADFTGRDAFTYRIEDEAGLVSAPATVTVWVEDPEELEFLLQQRQTPPWLMFILNQRRLERERQN